MRYVSHLRLPVTATFAVAMLLVLAFGVQLTLAQDPEVEGPELPEPGSEDAPGDIGYGVERPAVQGEQEDCEIDPGDPRCPPPAPHSIATPVVSFPTIIANLKASYQVVVWGPITQHSYKFELHRSTTATGTFQLNRSTWDGNREVDFYGVQRGYFYKLRAKRCRVWRSESDCGDWSRFSPSVYVPRPATALGLSRSKRQLTATYTAAGKSWDKIVIASKTIDATGNGTEAASNINGSGHNWTATRGNEYRFRVERCTTSTRSGCDRWSGWSPWVPVPRLPSRAGNLELERSITQLTLSFTASGAGYNRAEIEERTTGRDPQTSKETEDLGDKKSHTISGTRSNEYSFRVVRCTDSAYEDCGGWTSWTPWFKVPELPPKATNLELKRSITQLTLKFKTSGAGFNRAEIEERTTGRDPQTSEETEDLGDKTSHTISGTRSNEYRFRVVRCTDSAYEDCGGWTGWTAWKLVPTLPADAYGLGLTRSKTNLTATYSAEGASYDVVNIYGRRTPKYNFTAKLDSNAASSRSYTKSVDRGKEYRFQVKRCTDSEHTDCGSWKTWTGIWVKIPQLPGDPPKPRLGRVKNNLTVSYSASDSSKDKYDIRYPGTTARSFNSYRTGTKDLDDVIRNRRYSARVYRCTDDARVDCTEPSDWSDDLLVPNLPSSPGKPTITVSDDDLTVTYTPTDASYDQFQFKQSNLKTTGFTSYTDGTLSGNVLSDVETGKWYQASVKRCTDSKHTDCRSWSQYSDPKYVAPAQVQATPTIGSGADGKSVIASFTLLSGFTYSLTLYASADAKRYDARVGSETLDATDASHTFTGLIGGSDRRYLARLAACKSNNCTNYDSNNILLTKAPAPSISSVTLANEDDLTIAYTVPDWTNGSGDVYDFKIKRSDSATGSFADYEDADTPSGMPHKFNDVHTGYHYKARARRCSDSALTICGDWSGLSSAVNVPALSDPVAPSRILISILSHIKVRATFQSSTWTGQSSHYYVFEVGQSDSETGRYVYSDSTNLGETFRVDFDNVVADKWYQVRGKRCYSTARKRCGAWAYSSNSVNPVTPNPTIKVVSAKSVSVDGGLRASITVKASGLDQTKPYSIRFQTSIDLSTNAGVLKFDRCDASRPKNDRTLDKAAGFTSSGLLSVDYYGCLAGSDVLTVRLVMSGYTTKSEQINVSVIPVPAPTDLRANGHSPGATGQIALRWDAGSGATAHEYQLADADDPEQLPLTKLEWSDAVRLPASGVVDGLTMMRLFAIQLRTLRGGVESEWSETVYGFPTNRPPKYGDSKVIDDGDGTAPRAANLFLARYHADREFSYVVCLDSFTKNERAWADAVREGISSWTDAVLWRESGTGRNPLNIIRVSVTESRTCGSDDTTVRTERGVDTYVGSSTSYVRLEDTMDRFKLICGTLLVPDACVPEFKIPSEADPFQPWPADVQPSIRFSPGPSEAWDPVTKKERSGGESCSNVALIAAHEAGHALGVGHPPLSKAVASVMDLQHHRFCGPQPLDVVALMAIYQSAPSP